MNEPSFSIYMILFLVSRFLFVIHVPLIKSHLNTPAGLTWKLEKICVTELGAKYKAGKQDGGNHDYSDSFSKGSEPC